MPAVTITIEDTPAGGVSITSNFRPTVGAPCSAAQSAALDIVARTRREWGTNGPRMAEVAIDAMHSMRDRVIVELKKLPSMQERGR